MNFFESDYHLALYNRLSDWDKSKYSMKNLAWELYLYFLELESQS